MTARELLEGVLLPSNELAVGWPDEPAYLRIRTPSRLANAFARVLADFKAHWRAREYIADLSLNTSRNSLDVRVARCSDGAPETETRKAQADHREAVERFLRPLERLARRSRGETYSGCAGTYFGLLLPLLVAPSREDFPTLPDDSWDAHHREGLARKSWEFLRHEAYRFSNLATAIAAWSHAHGKRSVLVPSVGICVHPWLFANAGLDVTATDVSATAIAAVSAPEVRPLLYGLAAKKRWRISEIATYGGVEHSGFDSMPRLESKSVREVLRDNVRFLEADWTELPLADSSIDVIFSTNALPRNDDPTKRQAVFGEWSRVLRPGGHVFIAMHNGFWPDIGEHFKSLGWRRLDALTGESPTDGQSSWQEHYSSG